jgi:hypothetical protein
LPMKSGAKYCVVVMTDINELGHKKWVQYIILLYLNHTRLG